MRVIITGSSGMLGSKIVEQLLIKNKYEVFGFDQVSAEISNPFYKECILDLTDFTKLQTAIIKVKPDAIIHTAAIVNLNTCETNPELASKLHIEVSRYLAEAGARTIYISTDSVFNGKKGDYMEDDIPDPLNNYSKTKFLGEYAVKANNPNHVIIRTNIFGFNIPLKGSIAEWAIKSFENNEQITGFSDVFFNAIYTKHLAEKIEILLYSNFTGTIHIGTSNYISKYDFLKYLYEKFNLQGTGVNEGNSNEIRSNIVRPVNTTLNIDHAKALFKLPTVFEGIDELINDYFKIKES